MSNVEAIKKAFAEFTTLNLNFTPDSSVSNAVISPTDGYRGTYFTVIGAGDQQNDVANLFTLAVNSVPELLTTLEALQRENGELKERLDKGPHGEDAIDVAESAAGFLRHRAETAESEVKRLREALQPFSFERSKINIGRFDEDNQAWAAIDGAGPDRLMFFVRDILRARTALDSAGEEHHADK